MTSAWRSSPSEVDLLSWFTSHLVPLVFGGIATAFGVGVTLGATHGTAEFLCGSVSVVVMAVAFWSIILFSSSRRPPRKRALTVVPISIGWIAIFFVLVNEWGTVTPFELRWSPVALAFLVASLAPFLSALRVIIVGGTSTALMIGVTAFSVTVEPHPTFWPAPVGPILSGGMVLVATAASTVFCYQIVARTMRWSASVTGEELSSGVLGEAARRRILRQELESVSGRALPLLKRVTESGVVTAADQDEARLLSASLRSELVERSNRSWLESHTVRMNLTVIDRERLAERLNPHQRSVILSLLKAAVSKFEATSARPVIELRQEIDGGIAVAVSADRALPDGRQLTLLAPYYVNLVATVDDVEWQSGQKLHLSFRVPPGE